MSLCSDSGRRASGRLAGLAVLALVALMSGACDDSGPVEDVFLFEGELAFQGTEQHSLLSMDEGIARFEVLAITPLLFDATFGRTIRIGFGLGRPNGADCSTSFRTNAGVGSVFSIGLEKETTYCVEIFDPGSLPEDSLVAYTVAVTPG